MLGSIIKKLREKKQITQADLAKAIGVTTSSVGMYETGTRKPSYEVLIEISKVFGVSTDFLLYGFDRTLLTQYMNIIKGNRTYEQFSNDSGVDINKLSKICMGIITEKPAFDIIKKVTDTNKDRIDLIIGHDELFKAAGYNLGPHSKLPNEFKNNYTLHESQVTYNTNITDVKEAMKVILEQPGLMLNGEPLSDESKIALANAINMGLAYATQKQKEEKEKKNK